MDEPLEELRVGYKRMIRATKTPKERRLRWEENPDFTFSMRSLPGWLYYPSSDTAVRAN